MVDKDLPTTIMYTKLPATKRNKQTDTKRKQTKLQITKTTKESTGRYVYAITKKNNTSYSPKWPATQMAYKKLRQRHSQTQKKDKNTDTDKNKDKTQRQREKKHRQRHSGQERQTNLQNCKYIYQLINKTQITYPQRLCTTNFLQTR